MRSSLVGHGQGSLNNPCLLYLLSLVHSKPLNLGQVGDRMSRDLWISLGSTMPLWMASMIMSSVTGDH
jgi:hypothetical protein